MIFDELLSRVHRVLAMHGGTMDVAHIAARVPASEAEVLTALAHFEKLDAVERDAQGRAKWKREAPEAMRLLLRWEELNHSAVERSKGKGEPALRERDESRISPALLPAIVDRPVEEQLADGRDPRRIIAEQEARRRFWSAERERHAAERLARSHVEAGEAQARVGELAAELRKITLDTIRGVAPALVRIEAPREAQRILEAAVASALNQVPRLGTLSDGARGRVEELWQEEARREQLEARVGRLEETRVPKRQTIDEALRVAGLSAGEPVHRAALSRALADPSKWFAVRELLPPEHKSNYKARLKLKLQVDRGLLEERRVQRGRKTNVPEYRATARAAASIDPTRFHANSADVGRVAGTPSAGED